MLTKEECLEALEQSRFLEVIICDEKDFVGFYGDFDKTIIYKCFEQLINEHFDNSWNFKHFKLHSDSTLKSFKKDELIDYIHMIYHNWKVTDSFYESAVNYNYKLSKENEKLENQLVEIKSSETRNEPLKFEYLKEGMWVWDNKIKEYIKLEKHCAKGLGYLGYDLKINDIDWIDLEFEENRFYRYEVKEDV